MISKKVAMTKNLNMQQEGLHHVKAAMLRALLARHLHLQPKISASADGLCNLSSRRNRGRMLDFEGRSEPSSPIKVKVRIKFARSIALQGVKAA
jgi:hypothetical protein